MAAPHQTPVKSEWSSPLAPVLQFSVIRVWFPAKAMFFGCASNTEFG